MPCKIRDRLCALKLESPARKSAQNEVTIVPKTDFSFCAGKNLKNVAAE